MRNSVGEDQALQSRAEADPREADGVWERREPRAPWTTEPLNSDVIVGTSLVVQGVSADGSMHNADSQCTVKGREEAKAQRKNFMLNFSLSYHKFDFTPTMYRVLK